MAATLMMKMNPEIAPLRKPNPVALVVRVLVLTVLLTLFCFAVGLFFGILGVAIANAVRGGGVDLALAYRKIAFPIALVALVVTFLALMVSETRRYRRQRAEYKYYRQHAA